MLYAQPNASLTTAQTLKPLFQQYFSRERLAQALTLTLTGGKRGPYQRAWTPLVTLWGMVCQRLHPGWHGADVVSAFRSGAADDLDPTDRHAAPLSQRLRSEANAGYVQAQQRLPLALIQLGRADLQAAVAVAQAGAAHWHGHAVRLVDGTTYRLPGRGDLPATYGQATNQHGDSYWVTAKSVAAFCPFSRTLVAHAEGASTVSEASLLAGVLQADPQRDSVYVGDSGYGHYRVAQVAQAYGHPLVVRLEARVARKILRGLGQPARPASGWECPWTWRPEAETACEPDLPAVGIPGRLIYVRVTPPGGVPVDLYLFTSLTDAAAYPLADVVAVHALRWQAELRYRDIKTSLDMDEFDVRSADAFRRDLEVGLLTFNLISALMSLAALAADVPVHQLSFTACLRRLRDTLHLGVPAWVAQQYARPLDWLIERLAQCRLPSRLSRA